MFRYLTWLLSSAVLLGSMGGVVHASAQDPQKPAPEASAATDTEIKVRGEKVLEPPAIIQNLKILSAPDRFSDPLPRFYTPLCPRVAGIERALAEVVEERIRQNAELVGLDPAPPNCVPNGIVIVLEQPRAMFEQLRNKRPGLIGPHELRDRSMRAIRADLDAERPVVMWNHIVPFANNGIVLANGNFFQIVNGTVPRFANNAARAKDRSVVIFDKRQLADIDTLQMADLASLYLLGQPRHHIDINSVEVPTLLTLFRDGPQEAPTGLTEFDRAYLQGVYTIPRNAWSKRLGAAVVSMYRENCEAPGGTCDLNFAD